MQKAELQDPLEINQHVSGYITFRIKYYITPNKVILKELLYEQDISKFLESIGTVPKHIKPEPETLINQVPASDQ